ncbi:hypothetical protein Acsp03_24910 [Actinomadura sp. NBRC 104412]|uniref:hypothetical protein n=1 Tax=Actinomadura sp. NBRC 104412 TaxID=3032203 RepID=UPI00249FB5BA|nr:hypothetical protein [Actinomadura sp. NBRC 104412]GLZ05025.1 hypothetical protein Acsp03_24910 [Actinomadura sp. NBRC 104412]
MALSGRTRIAVAVAGVAGAAALGLGGAALADPGGGRTELRIVTGHQDGGPAVSHGNAGWTGKAPGEDCPERSGGADPAQAADGR